MKIDKPTTESGSTDQRITLPSMIILYALKRNGNLVSVTLVLYLENIFSENTTRFFKYVLSFFNIMHERFNEMKTLRKIFTAR